MTKGDRIRQLREKKSLTQEDLARLLNTKRQTISKYEKNIVTNIPSDKLEELAKILGTTPEYILGWDEEKPTTQDDGLLEGLTEIDMDIVKKLPLLSPELKKEYSSYLTYLLSKQEP